MTSRKEFEAHIRKQFPTASDDLLLGRSSNGRYGSMVTEHAWLAWQASALSAPEAEPYAWHYTNNGGASVWHMGPSNRFDADMQASKDYPRAHRMVPLYLHPSAPERKPMTDEDTLALFNRIQLRMRFTDADARPFASGVASAEFFHGIK